MAASASRITSPGCAPGDAMRDPDRRRQVQLAVLDLERRGQRLEHAVGDQLGLLAVGEVLQQHRELVAAEPRDGVPRAQRGLQPARDLDQQVVADEVPERVVDDLEAVEVEEQHRRALASFLRHVAAHGVLEAVQEQHAVRQAGQRVVQRVVLELGLRALALGDVGLRAGDARRPAVDRAHGEAARQHPAVAAVAAAHAVLGLEVRRAALEVGGDRLLAPGRGRSGWMSANHSAGCSPISVTP